MENLKKLPQSGVAFIMGFVFGYATSKVFNWHFRYILLMILTFVVGFKLNQLFY